MQNMKILTETLLAFLYDKYSKGQNIRKEELDVFIESCKKDHESNVDNDDNLTETQRKKLKFLYNNAADSIKEYCKERFRIEGRLVE